MRKIKNILLSIIALTIVSGFIVSSMQAQTKKKPKKTTSANPYVLNESLAKTLVGAYVRNNWNTSVMVRTPDFSKQLNEETLLNYITVVEYITTSQAYVNSKNPADGTNWTEGNAFMLKLVQAGLLDVKSRIVSITNVTGEYERQSNTGPCAPMRIKIWHKSPTSPQVSGTATWVSTLYRDCDYPHQDSVSGVVDESGYIGLELPIYMSSEYYWFKLVNGTLESQGKGVWQGLENRPFRRTTGDMPPIKITKYKYSLTEEAKALGLTASGDTVKIGEMTFNGVSNLLLQGSTNATGLATFSYRYNRLRSVLMPSVANSLTRRVSFGQRPDGKWVFTGFQ